MSLADKINAWAKSPQGQAKIQGKLMEYAKKGISTTAAGTPLASREALTQAGNRMIDCLVKSGAGVDLPPSVMAHISQASATDPRITPAGYEVCVTFYGDLHRDSLDTRPDSKNAGGLDNIVAMFNNGYEKGIASDYVYGEWHGENIRSRREREETRFIQTACEDFVKIYGKKYNIVSVTPSDKYEG